MKISNPIVRHPSCVIHRASSIVRHPSCVIHRASSIVRIEKFVAMVLLLVSAALSCHAQTLGQALNATNLTWTTSGFSNWTVQTNTTHDGVLAARSGLVSGANQTSALRTTVTGPGKLEFWWLSSFSDTSTLYFAVNGVVQTSISSLGIWRKETFYLGAGTETLGWTNVGSPGAGYGYLDEVTYAPGSSAPAITVQPLGQSQVPGMKTIFVVTAVGTPPLAFQWRLDDVNIVNATNTILIVTNTQTTNLGNYTVVVSNSVSSLVSSNVPLGFGQVTGWGRYESGETSVLYGMTNIIGIFSGHYSLNAIGLKSDQTVNGWGGQGVYFDTGTLPVPEGLSNVVALALGGYHALALNEQGNLVSWGQNSSGQTNLPSVLTNVVSISSGFNHNIALKKDGTVLAWGSNSGGQTNTPAGLSNVVAVAAGNEFCLILKSDGNVQVWGRYVFSPATIPSNITNITAITAGRSHGVGLRSDGIVLAWGDNTFGQRNVPASLSNVVAVSAGHYHSMALKSDGTVIAWGNNTYGQTNVPANLTNVNAIAGGEFFGTALVGNGPPITSASMNNPNLSTNGFSVSVPTQSGRVYRLEHKSSLADANWTALPLAAGNGTNLILTDPTALGSQRFYRVRRW